MVELSKREQLKRAKVMGVGCLNGTSLIGQGVHTDGEGELMGELDCLVEVMMQEDLSGEELVKKYGLKLWEMVS